MRVKIVAEVSEEHAEKFNFLKGAHNSKNNGDALEPLIDTAYKATIEAIKRGS